MLKCRQCGNEKPDSEFSYRSIAAGKRSSVCKECHKDVARTWYATNKDRHKRNARNNNRRYRAECKAYIREYLSRHPCVDCGNTDVRVLEFDHVRKVKRKAVASLVSSCYPLNIIKMEIEKCAVRCANCHRIRHCTARVNPLASNELKG